MSTSTIIRNEKDVYKIVFLGCYKLLLPNVSKSYISLTFYIIIIAYIDTISIL